MSGMATNTVSDRLVDAAFELFVERGYDQTTVDDIAERAKVSRTTFFRTYRSKEDVIFPPHELGLPGEVAVGTVHDQVLLSGFV